MKTKPIYFVLIIALLGMSIYYNYRQYVSNSDANERLETLQKTSNKQSVIITRYIAPDSTKHAEYSEVYAKTDAEKELAVSPGYVDSLRKALDIKTSQITELSRFKATASATVKTQVTNDSLGKQVFSYSGKWLTATVSARDSLLKYKYRVELVDAKYYKGNWFTGKTWYRDVHLADTNAFIQNVERFTVPIETPKRFGIGLQAGYYYDPSKRQFLPAFGVGISYNLIKL